MLTKCETCEKEFAPARNNILNCNKCRILNKQITNHKKTIKKNHTKRMNQIVKVMNKIVKKHMKKKKIKNFNN